MNLKNLFTLTIKVREVNSLVDNPQLVKSLRKLTVFPGSGLNHELDHLLSDAKYRKVNAKVLLACKGDRLVAWALMSKEETDFHFQYTGQYRPQDGYLIEVFVDPKFRRQGIGRELMKVARRKAGPYRLCVAPWDERSRSFYQSFSHYKTKWL